MILFTSALVVAEASDGHPEAAARRLESLQGIAELLIDEEIQALAEKLIAEGGIPEVAKADALHVAVAAVQGMYGLSADVELPTYRQRCQKTHHSCHLRRRRIFLPGNLHPNGAFTGG